jgi:hypothetical protein
MDVLTRVCLIANNPNIKDIPEADIYYHFNSAIHWGKTPNDQSAIVVRMAYTVRDAKTFRCYPNTELAKDVIACGWENEIRSFCESNPFTHRSSSKFYLSRSNYPANHSPTSGWAVIQHLLQYEDIQIICVGFDLKTSSYYKTSKLHALDFEIAEFAKLVQDGMIIANQCVVASALPESL